MRWGWCGSWEASEAIETQIIIRGREPKFPPETWVLSTDLLLNIYSWAPMICHLGRFKRDRMPSPVLLTVTAQVTVGTVGMHCRCLRDR